MFQQGANFNIENDNGDTLLAHVLLNYCADFGHFLLQNGFDPNERSDTTQRRAIDVLCDHPFDHCDELSVLLGYGASTSTNPYLDPPQSPLMMTIENHSWRQMNILLQHQVDPEECFDNIISPLAMTISLQFYEGMVVLLEHNVNPTITQGQPKYNQTTLTYLGQCIRHLRGMSQLSYIDTLIHYGADINSTSDEGTPFIEAILQENTFVAEHFINHGCEICFNQTPQHPTTFYGRKIFDFHTVLDMNTNTTVRDTLNKLLWGSGEQIAITISKLNNPHPIVQLLDYEVRNFSLMSLTRKALRSCLLHSKQNLIYQVKFLPLPKLLQNYLVYQ